MSERQDKMKEIEEVRAIIKDFADHDLYSANCDEVKIELNGALSPIKISPVDSDEFLFLVLPVRLKND